MAGEKSLPLFFLVGPFIIHLLIKITGLKKLIEDKENHSDDAERIANLKYSVLVKAREAKSEQESIRAELEEKINQESEQKTKEKGGRKEMQTMTSAYANKMLKSLEEDKAFWVNKEATSSTYVAAINEEPVVPEYDYTEVVATITSLDEKIAIIKHALNVTNSNEKVQVGDAEMSIDTILIKMAQLNKRKSVLDQMRKQLPKAREEQRSYMSRNTVPEYRYINYDLELIKKEYEAVSKTIMEMQMALDKYNQTVQFEVDI